MGDLSNGSSSTVHVGPGEGWAVRMAQAQLITRKVSSEQTGGAHSLFEVAVRAVGSSQAHVQHREDECFYVLEGEFEFFIEGTKIEAATGSQIYVPKGNLHAFKNVGGKSGRMLVSQTPGGVYEGLVEEVGEPATGDNKPPTMEEPPNVLGKGDHELAAWSFGESLERHLELGEQWLAADCLDGLARMASEQGNPVRAARSWGAAEALSENIGATTAPLDQAAYERHLVEARARLGEAAFAAAWAEGRAMTLEEAVEDALDKRE